MYMFPVKWKVKSYSCLMGHSSWLITQFHFFYHIVNNADIKALSPLIIHNRYMTIYGFYEGSLKIENSFMNFNVLGIKIYSPFRMDSAYQACLLISAKTLLTFFQLLGVYIKTLFLALEPDVSISTTWQKWHDTVTISYVLVFRAATITTSSTRLHGDYVIALGNPQRRRVVFWEV